MQKLWARNNRKKHYTWLLTRGEVDFLVVKHTCSLSRPRQAYATSKEATGIRLQAAIVGLVSPVDFFAELCINTGALLPSQEHLVFANHT